MNYSNGKLYKLRKINRDLFDKLESNSALLENKLRKLKESTRNSRDFRQSCQSSSLKNQHRSWKMRNDSGQVFEVLNSEFNMQKNSSDSTPQTEILQGKGKTEELIMAQPSVKSKRKQFKKGTRHSFSHNRSRVSQQQQNYSETYYSPAEDKRNDSLYNTSKNGLQINHKNQHMRTLSDSEENISIHKHKTVNAQSRRNYMPFRHGDEKLLQEVGNIIDYSPKSTFLQRLKERSQRNVYSNNGSARKAVYIKSQMPATMSSSNMLKKGERGTAVESTRENQLKSSMKEAAKSANVNYFACCGSSPCACNSVSNTPTLKKQDILLGKQKKNRKQLRKKRVCYRRNCYCRKTLQGGPSGDKKTSAKEENLPYTVNEVDASPKTPSFSYRQCCNLCSPHSAHSKKDNAALGRIPSIRVPEESSCCTCQDRGSWFNALRKFRDSHWFDCHAKPINVCLYPNEHRIIENHCKCFQEDQHTCIHQYVVNDRLFMQPVCADHKGRSRCIYCKLPRKVETTSTPQNETKPAKEEVLVSLPLSLLSPEKNKYCMSSNKPGELKQSPFKRRVRQKRSPPPANSLALRYQKGIL